MCLRSYFHLPKIVLESHFTLVFLFEVISTPPRLFWWSEPPLILLKKWQKFPVNSLSPICIGICIHYLCTLKV